MSLQSLHTFPKRTLHPNRVNNASNDVKHEKSRKWRQKTSRSCFEQTIPVVARLKRKKALTTKQRVNLMT